MGNHSNAEIEALIDRELAQRKLEAYQPYAKQAEFHAAGNHRERLFIAGNQCITPWTFVETESGPRRAAEVFASKGARVVALADGSEYVSSAQNGILRGIEPAYRFVMESGLFFDSSAEHQVATEQGWMRISRLMSLASGRHCWHRAEDFQASCVADGYLCDPQLLKEEGIGLALPQELVGALNSTLTFSLEDAEARISQCTSFFRQSGRLTIADDGSLQHADLYAQFAGASSLSSVLRTKDCIQVRQQSEAESSRTKEVLAAFLAKEANSFLGSRGPREWSAFAGTPAQSISEAQEPQQSSGAQDLGCSLQELHRDESRKAIFYPSSHPELVGGGRIVAVIPIGFQPIIDVQVPGPNNYKSAGAYHHNCGKTIAGAAEMAAHLTGRYPDGWQGRRFTRAIAAWASGVTGESVRDTTQRLLVGRPGEYGTGMIPASCFASQPKRAMGVADLLDSVTVRHVSGGNSRLYFKRYEQGREKWQGETLDVVWFDEEPAPEIYTEGLTRTNATGGMAYMTFTPLQGMSEVVMRFLHEESPDRHVTYMTIDDAEHYTPEQREAIVAAYPAHEREARAKGVPTLGSGRIFPVEESAILVQPFKIPAHWPRINGLDFGWDHPAAGVQIAWDRDTDCIYVVKAHRAREQTPILFAPTVKAWGAWVPCAWPHDGLQHDKGSGQQLAQQYASAGLKMLKTHATHAPQPGEPDGSGGNGVEAGLMEMLDRMQTGRFKVFAGLDDWLQEFRLYHRRDGKVVKERDDILSATRYAQMMKRKAITQPIARVDVVQKWEPLDAEVGY